GMGINPAWLLTGEGSSSLTDVSDQTGKTAGRLLDLVQAMSAISKMKLGSLAGKQHAKTLRELNDALDAYERVRAELQKQTRPIYRELVDNLQAAMNAREYRRVPELKSALEQVARLCPDEELELIALHRLASYEYWSLNFSRALEIQRDVFYRALRKGRRLDGYDLENAHNFSRYLKQSCYASEAIGICRAALALAAPKSRWSNGWKEVMVALGWFEAEAGELSRGLARMQKVFPALSREAQNMFYGVLLRPQMFAGVVDVQTLLGTPRKITNAAIPTCWTFAACEEDIAALRRLLAIYPNKDMERQRRMPYFMAGTAILKAADHSRSLDVAAFGEELVAESTRSGIPESAAKAMALIVMAQIARVSGNAESGRKLTHQADAALNSLPDDVTLPLLAQAKHHRNVLDCYDSNSHKAGVQAMRRRSERFFRRHIKRGYGFFRKLYPLTPSNAE
ncbi:MAG: hypothetical protein HUU29_12265, partial [Planctomycetaceae bacterium]|nr:hypothetical protein [Planctomycetaceae bacterium]